SLYRVTSIGLPIFTRISPGRIRHDRLGISFPDPSTVTGQIGTPALRASANGPFLKGRMRRGGDRVPSGKTRMLVPARIFWAPLSRDAMAERVFERSTIM